MALANPYVESRGADPNDPRVHRRVFAQLPKLSIDFPQAKQGAAQPQTDGQKFEALGGGDEGFRAPARGQDSWQYDRNKVAGMDKGQYEQALGRPLTDDEFAKVQTHSRPLMVTKSNGNGGWDNTMTGAYGDNGYAKGRALEIGEGFKQYPQMAKAYPAGGVRLGGATSDANKYAGFEDSTPVEDIGGDTGPAVASKPQPVFGTQPALAPGQPQGVTVGGPNLHQPGMAQPTPPWMSKTPAATQANMNALTSAPAPAPSSTFKAPQPAMPGDSNYTQVKDPGNFEPYEDQQPSFPSYLAAREKF